MIRRSFRIGLTLGLVGGLAVAMVKVLRPRPGADPTSTRPSGAPWPELTTDPAVPARPATSLQADPAAPAPPAPVEPSPPVATTPLQTEPVAEPAPLEVAPPEPAAPTPAASGAAPSKKTAPKKAAQPPAKKPAARKPAKAWVEPSGDVCPTSHPVKAKLTSKIFHLPGMLNYERTRPDRCYRDADAAEGDGLRAAKR